MKMIAIPYNIASLLPRDLFSDLFKKKLTVMGMIGHTQGVNNARNPPAKPAKNINHNEMSLEFPI
ncbi:hypothetical protein SDC9_170658 [bioreactor metagenome]|uniref:Uncharacterized protein n=1 Tax=bioreactor metagenome TaxID=1076179 RepID=A0A645GB55_9ZZZZ